MVALGWAVSYLAAATRARRPEMVRFAAYLPVVGAVLAGVAAVVGAIAAESAYSSFLSGPHTVDAAAKIGSNSLLIAASFLSFIGGFLLGGGLVLVCLNAMRAGLLTRFMGVLGIIVGVLEALPFFGALPIAEPLWLLALGAVYLGLTPTGLPPAWRTGKAEPWPTQAELAQQRQAAAAARRGGTPAAEPPQPERRPAPVGGSAKRKRKRRR
jgi:hypothetical protein